MKIIIEGPNNVGKTTFIERLLQNLPEYKVEHISANCPNDFKFHDDLLTTMNDVIFDRFAIGELVYSKLYNREPQLTFEDVQRLQYDHPDTIWVLLDADYDFIIKACENKQEEFCYDTVMHEKLLFNSYVSKLNLLYCKNHLTGPYGNEYGNRIDVIHRILRLCRTEDNNDVSTVSGNT